MRHRGPREYVPITTEMGPALGWVIVTTNTFACVVDLSELGCSASRRRFMAGFAEALYDTPKSGCILSFARLTRPEMFLRNTSVFQKPLELIVARDREASRRRCAR